MADSAERLEPCPCCRDYDLERQWCHLCNNTGRRMCALSQFTAHQRELQRRMRQETSND